MLKRGIVFIDLATAQIIGLAIVLLALFFDEPSWPLRQAASFGTGICVALFFRWIERKTPEEQEAVIGSSFILAASVALLALADDPHGGEALRHLLSGQILFVSWGDIAAFLPVYALVALVWAGVPRARSGIGFFVLFALAITASVQLVGVYVVFASLILPALAARSGGGYDLRRAFASGAVAVVAGGADLDRGRSPRGTVPRRLLRRRRDRNAHPVARSRHRVRTIERSRALREICNSDRRQAFVFSTG